MFLNEADAATAAAGDDVLAADALDSALQQRVKVLCTKQQQLEDEQKQVNTAFLNISCSCCKLTANTLYYYYHYHDYFP